LKIKLISKNKRGRLALEKLFSEKNDVRSATITIASTEPYTLVYILNRGISKKLNILGSFVAAESAKIMLSKVLKKYHAKMSDCELVVE